MTDAPQPIAEERKKRWRMRMRKFIFRWMFKTITCRITYDEVVMSRTHLRRPKNIENIVFEKLRESGFRQMPLTFLDEPHTLSRKYIQFLPKYQWIYRYVDLLNRYDLLPTP